MKKFLLPLMLVMTVVLGFAAAHAADDRPLLSPDRVQIGAGLNYEFNTPGTSNASPVQIFGKEWTAGVYGSYNLVPKLDLIAFSKFGLDNHDFNSALGLRLVIWCPACAKAEVRP